MLLLRSSVLDILENIFSFCLQIILKKYVKNLPILLITSEFTFTDKSCVGELHQVHLFFMAFILYEEENVASVLLTQTSQSLAEIMQLT